MSGSKRVGAMQRDHSKEAFVMPRSMQLRGYRGRVHTIGIAASSVLYVDVQNFADDGGSDATTYYVRDIDVLRIKRLASQGRSTILTDVELLRLLAASFHSAEYLLEWLQWAHIPTVMRHDEEARYNAEEHIPHEVLTGLPQAETMAVNAYTGPAPGDLPLTP
jgi:hypothetical protein